MPYFFSDINKEPLKVKVSTKDIDDNKFYDIYILIIDTKKPIISNAIKMVTDAPYNHASISFDSSLTKLYSFNLDKDGPVVEDLKKTYNPEAVFSLYRLKVTGRQYINMVKVVKKVFHSNEYKFNFRGMLLSTLSLTSESDTSFFCSQFVAWVLQSVGINALNKPIDKIVPYDFTKSKMLKFVYRGKVKNYSPDKIEK